MVISGTWSLGDLNRWEQGHNMLELEPYKDCSYMEQIQVFKYHTNHQSELPGSSKRGSLIFQQ